MSTKAAGARVLVVDPSADTRLRYREAFRDAGYRVRSTAQRADASARARSTPPHVIVIASGDSAPTPDAFIARLRRDPKLRDVPILVVGVPAQPRTLQAALAADATAALPKCHDLRAVLRLVAMLIDHWRDPTAYEGWRLELSAILKSAQPNRYVDHAVRGRAEALLARLTDTRVAILVANNDARYVDVNGAACELTGYSRVDLLTRSVWDLTPSPARTGRALWQQFLDQGFYDGVYTIARQDGGLVSVHAIAAANVLPGLHVSGLAFVPSSERSFTRGAA